MIHFMNLEKMPFEMIRSGDKTIELRLNDEKRIKIRNGDYIVFTSLEDKNRRLIVEVINLFKFKNFKELYEVLPLDKCGYTVDGIMSADPKDMLKYYSIKQQNKYGVLGIEIKLMSKKEVIKLIDMDEDYYEQKAYVHYHTWCDTYTGIMKQEYLDKITLEKCIFFAKNYPENTILALLDNEVVGFTSYNKSSDGLENTGEIYAIYVLKAYQKLGIGKLLLNECLKKLSIYQEILLYVLENNINSIDWYEYNGFTFDGYIKSEATSIEGYFLSKKRMVYRK